MLSADDRARVRGWLYEQGRQCTPAQEEQYMRLYAAGMRAGIARRLMVLYPADPDGEAPTPPCS